MQQKIAHQAVTIWLERPDEYPPAIPEKDMPLPLRRIKSDARCQFNYLAIRVVAKRPIGDERFQNLEASSINRCGHSVEEGQSRSIRLWPA